MRLKTYSVCFYMYLSLLIMTTKELLNIHIR